MNMRHYVFFYIKSVVIKTTQWWIRLNAIIRKRHLQDICLAGFQGRGGGKRQETFNIPQFSSMLPQIVGDCPPNGYDPGRNGYDQTVGPNAAHWKSHGSDRCQQTNSFCGAFHKHLRIPHNHVSFQLIPGWVGSTHPGMSRVPAGVGCQAWASIGCDSGSLSVSMRPRSPCMANAWACW